MPWIWSFRRCPATDSPGRPTTTGWDCTRIARAWATLIKGLGYTRYAAQGGDWGSVVTEQKGVQAVTSWGCARRHCMGLRIHPSAYPLILWTTMHGATR